jgi:hypothetical protein
MSKQVVVEELCLTCSEPLVVVGHQTHCPTCQPRTTFVVGYESASRYSYTRVDPREARTMKLAPKRRTSSLVRLAAKHREEQNAAARKRVGG